ncbi:MAG: hypothetical protein EXX96DRAFT_479258, partial [Benjaminiella poitrasii]
FVRPQIDYGICILNFINTHFTVLRRIQDDCLRLIVDGFGNSSVEALCIVVNLSCKVYH